MKKLTDKLTTMMSKKIRKALLLLVVIYLALVNPLFAADPFAPWTKSELLLNNGVVQRTIQLPGEKGKLLTTLYKPVSSGFRYFMPVNNKHLWKGCQ